MSKKRKKKNNQPSYPRKTTTSYTKMPIVTGDIQVETDGRMLILKDTNGNPLDFGTHTMVKSYDGKSKNVKLSKVSGLDYDFFDINDIPQYFDYVFAIDTNKTTEKNHDYYNGVGFASYCQFNTEQGVMTCRPYMAIDWYCSFEENLEPHSWKTVIEHLQTIIPSDKKVGIVVDSEYDKLDAFNSRVEPLVFDWYLPENYSLIFATADKTDDWCNRAIKYCDKNANLRKAQIVKNPKDTVDPTNGYSIKGYISYLDELTP